MGDNTPALWVVRMVEEQHHRDDEGRLLRESRAPDACIRPGEIEYKPCPYSGSRKLDPPLPMNVSALRTTSANWDDIINSLAFLRAAYSETTGIREMTVMDVWRVSQLGSSLPWFYILGHDEVCPGYAANLAKATLGMGMWGQRVYADQRADITWELPPLTPQRILELAEANGTLVGHAEVCSGPEKMLLRFFASLLDRLPAIESPHLTRLAAQRDSVTAFGTAFYQLKLVLYVLANARRFVYADLSTALPTSTFGALLAAPAEPPDFFMVSPTVEAMVELPTDHRLAWLARFAIELVPSGAVNAALLGTFQQFRRRAAPGSLVAEVAQRTGCSAATAQIVALAIVDWTLFDAALGVLLGLVENALRDAVGAPRHDAPVLAADRDRLVQASARSQIAELAPVGFAALVSP